MLSYLPFEKKENVYILIIMMTLFPSKTKEMYVVQVGNEIILGYVKIMTQLCTFDVLIYKSEVMKHNILSYFV